MTTTIIHSIGSNGRDYSKITAWANAIPSNLITVDQQWIGQLYNDSEFTGSSGVVLPAITTDNLRNVILTTGPGQGFRNAANVATNALAYNIAFGAGIAVSAQNTPIFNISSGDYVFSGLQMRSSDTVGGTGAILQNGLGGSLTINNCLFEIGVQPGGNTIVYANHGGVTITNSVFFMKGAYGGAIYTITPGLFVNCTVVRSLIKAMLVQEYSPTALPRPRAIARFSISNMPGKGHLPLTVIIVSTR